MEEKFKINIDPVSYDKNWRTRVRNEQNSADQWQQDWGFLASGSDDLKKEDALKIFTIDDKIRLAQEELKKCKQNGNFFTNNAQYGNLNPIDKSVTKNVRRNTDLGLLPCTRKFNPKLYGKRPKPKPPAHLPELKLYKGK